MPNCPHCNRPMPKPKIAGQIRAVQSSDTSTMSEAAMRAYFKRTNRQESIRCKLRLSSISPELRAAYIALQAADECTTIQESAFWKQYHALGARLRGEFAQQDRAIRAAAGHRLNSDGVWMMPDPELPGEWTAAPWLLIDIPQEAGEGVALAS